MCRKSESGNKGAAATAVGALDRLYLALFGVLLWNFADKIRRQHKGNGTAGAVAPPLSRTLVHVFVFLCTDDRRPGRGTTRTRCIKLDTHT